MMDSLFSTQPRVRDWIDQTLREKMNIVFLEVFDLNGGDDHFDVRIASPEFDGKSMVQQHQIVYKALGDAMKQRIHALTLKTYTSTQWKEKSK